MTETENRNVTIRRAERNDETAIEIILSTYFLDRDDIPHNEFYVAEKNGKIIGCAVFEKLKTQKTGFYFYEIHTIAVLPSYKGKGYGKQLLAHLMTEISRRISETKTHEKQEDSVYTRTTAPDFFIHEGFEKTVIDKKEQWEECMQCNNIEICSQTVLTKRI